jgi:formamidopyrimidine-DNA glycosylase
MPELPDIVVYMEALEERVVGHALENLEVRGPALLRTADPPIYLIQGHRVTTLRRVGKRIAFGFDNDLWLVFHLMIAGRLHWSQKKKIADGRRALAAFDFDSGTLTLTEAGTRKRASLHLVKGEAGLAALDPGGIDVYAVSLEQFRAVLTSANHTLKRALTDPRLSPVLLTERMKPEEIKRLYEATKQTLTQWTENLRKETGAKFPEKVTAFREEMAVHGRYGKPCPRCGAKVQRIRYASNETDYCPHCQTAGKLLADRSLSRLLRQDWPRTPEELEERRRA